MRDNKQLRIITGRLNTGSGLTFASDPGVGAYSAGTGLGRVTLPAGFHVMGVTASAYATSGSNVCCSTFIDSNQQIQVNTFLGTTGAASSQVANFIAVGY